MVLSARSPSILFEGMWILGSREQLDQLCLSTAMAGQPEAQSREEPFHSHPR